MAANSEISHVNEATATHLAREMAAEGLPAPLILERLIDAGVNRGIAAFVIHQRSGAVNRPRSRVGLGRMTVGAIIFLVGAALTASSYLGLESSGIGGFTLFAGAILVGSFQFLHGLALYLKS